MSAMKVTIRGFYDIMGYLEDDLFKNMVIPNSPLLERNTLILNILQKSDDMESLYSDPYYIQESLTYWSKKWERTFQKWVDSLNLQYDPLTNYDKHDTVMDKTTVERDVSEADTTRTVTDDDSKTATDIKESTNTDIKAATKTDIKESTNTDLTESNTISAYNSSTFQPDRSTSTSGTANNNYTRTDGDDDDNFTHTTGTAQNNYVQTSGSANNNYTNRDIEESFTRADKLDDDSVKDFAHNQHAWGKYGTEKYSDMVKAELELAKWNIYDHITDIFLQEYCIMVY